MLTALHTHVDHDKWFMQQPVLDYPPREWRLVVMVKIHKDAQMDEELLYKNPVGLGQHDASLAGSDLTIHIRGQEWHRPQGRHCPEQRKNVNFCSGSAGATLYWRPSIRQEVRRGST